MEGKNLWGDIKKGASEGFGAFKVEVSKVAREIEKQGRAIKKKMDLSSIQRLVNQSYTRLGARIYELTEEGKSQDILKDEVVSSIISQINGHKSEVKRIEKEIEEIKKATKTTEKTSGGEPPKKKADSQKPKPKKLTDKESDQQE
jgi:hypothetical protein